VVENQADIKWEDQEKNSPKGGDNKTPKGKSSLKSGARDSKLKKIEVVEPVIEQVTEESKG